MLKPKNAAEVNARILELKKSVKEAVEEGHIKSDSSRKLAREYLRLCMVRYALRVQREFGLEDFAHAEAQADKHMEAVAL